VRGAMFGDTSALASVSQVKSAAPGTPYPGAAFDHAVVQLSAGVELLPFQVPVKPNDVLPLAGIAPL
jgi:hypothetical protein